MRGAAHQALRAGTAEAHERLDGLFERFDLGSREGYVRFLTAHAAALLPMEAALDAAGAERVIADWPERRRGPMIRADLAALGAPLPDPVPAPELPEGADPAAIAGAVYVLEGSRLGGRMLERQVAPGLPRAYLLPPQDRGHWPKMLEKLEALLYEPATMPTAIAAALAVFAVFERAGRQWLPGETA